MAFSFLATAYVARNLGPQNFGQLGYALSFIGLFSVAASLGIDQVLYRDLINFPDKKGTYLGTSILIKIITSAIAIVLCIFTAMSLSDDSTSIILISILSLSFILNAFYLLGYEFQARAESKYVSIVSLLVVLILNISKIAIIFFGGGIFQLAIIYILEPILYSVGFIYLRQKCSKDFSKLTFDLSIAKQIIRDSLPLALAAAFASIYARIDQIMIKDMIGVESVGLYDSAVRISELWYFLPTMIVSSLFPAIINAKNTSPEIYYKRTKKLFGLVLAITALTSLFTAVFSRELILVVFGAGFIGSIGILNVYVWSNIGTSLTLVTQQMLIAENFVKISSLVVFIGMIFNVVLNIFLIPVYGAIGAAIATLISYFIPFLTLFAFSKSRKILLLILKS